MPEIDRENDVGRYLANLRKQLEISQTQLATTSGVSVSHISRLESGERNPSAKVLKRLAAPLGLDERELLMLAGLYSPIVRDKGDSDRFPTSSKLIPPVANMLANEPVEIQRSVVAVLEVFKNTAKLLKQ